MQPRNAYKRLLVGRPHKSFERINRIFPECIEKVEDNSLSAEEQRERAQFIAFCRRVCAMSATQPPQQEGAHDER